MEGGDGAPQGIIPATHSFFTNICFNCNVQLHITYTASVPSPKLSKYYGPLNANFTCCCISPVIHCRTCELIFLHQTALRSKLFRGNALVLWSSLISADPSAPSSGATPNSGKLAVGVVCKHVTLWERCFTTGIFTFFVFMSHPVWSVFVSCFENTLNLGPPLTPCSL